MSTISQASRSLDRLRAVVEAEVAARLPSLLLERMVRQHTKKGNLAGAKDCPCEYCRTKVRLTGDLWHCDWRLRDTKAHYARLALRKTKEFKL
jgi:hypothetical protein